METVCLMKRITPTIKTPARGSTPAVVDFWEPAKKLMSDTNFLQSLIEYDREGMDEEIAASVRPYLSNPDFEPERVRKASFAACGLCKWVRAMMLFYEGGLDAAASLPCACLHLLSPPFL